MLLDPEISFSVIIRYSLNYLAEGFFVIGVLPVFNPFAYQIAGDPSEVIMACVGKEGSGIREHVYEVA